MKNTRDYFKIVIPDSNGNILYVGITEHLGAETERIQKILGVHVYPIRIGRRTTRFAAERWMHSELKNYALSHNGEIPLYNRAGWDTTAMMQGYNPMMVSIKNLGVVKEATLDLSKKLTIFCGPNNTGKTYISYVVNALILASSNFVQRGDAFLEKGDEPNDVVLSYLITRKYVTDSRRAQVLDVNNGFDSIFGISGIQGKNLFNNASVDFVGEDELFWQYVKQRELDIWTKYMEYDVHIIKKQNSMRVYAEVKNAGTKSEHKLLKSYYPITDFVASTVIHYPYCDASMFPVERNSVYTFSKELSINRNLLIDEIQSGGSRFSPAQMIRKRSTRYPMAVRDMLSVAEDATALKRRKGEYFKFAQELENDFLHGKIEVGKEGDMRFISGGQTLPIHLSASIVKTLSSLTFYLRHLAKPNDLVIIDEPELNLHPDCQIALARLFARMINNGLRMLISTHSDYIIRELNNLVMISSLKQSVREEAIDCGYNIQEEAISPNDVGAYLFQKGEDDMVVVKELQVEEDGFAVETIDKVIGQLNDQSQELFMRLKYAN